MMLIIGTSASVDSLTEDGCGTRSGPGPLARTQALLAMSAARGRRSTLASRGADCVASAAFAALSQGQV